MSDAMVVTGFLCFVGVLFFFIFWGAWRAYTPKGFAMYLGMWVCMVAGVAFAVNSTLPSSAPRRNVVGTITGIRDRHQGRSHTYTVFFTTNDGRELKLEGAATPLFFAEGRDTVAITYLDEHSTLHDPRAIRFRALTGPRAGEETSVNADWLGPWLGVLLSMIVGAAAIFGANSNRRSSAKSIDAPKTELPNLLSH